MSSPTTTTTTSTRRTTGWGLRRGTRSAWGRTTSPKCPRARLWAPRPSPRGRACTKKCGTTTDCFTISKTLPSRARCTLLPSHQHPPGRSPHPPPPPPLPPPAAAAAAAPRPARTRTTCSLTLVWISPPAPQARSWATPIQETSPCLLWIRTWTRSARAAWALTLNSQTIARQSSARWLPGTGWRRTFPTWSSHTELRTGTKKKKKKMKEGEKKTHEFL